MKYLIKPSTLRTLLDLASKGLISPDTPFEDILPIYRHGGKKKVKVDPLELPRLPQDEILDTFRLGLTVEGLEAELYKAMGITKGSAAAAHNLKQ